MSLKAFHVVFILVATLVSGGFGVWSIRAFTVQGGTVYSSSGTTLGNDYERADDLRELRINLVARSRLQDDEFTRGRPQALENRNPAGFVNDGYRRRVLSSRIRLRNVGMRG